jgi:RimJ/RimL family protein N-acetyltransferase
MLETERLALRRHRRADAPAIARLLNDWDVVRWLAVVPFPYTEKDAHEWIAQTNRNWADGRDYQFVVTLRASGTMVGHMGLRIEKEKSAGELGYWFGQAHWGAGYGSEAAAAVIDFGFRDLDLERIWATCLPDNDRSRRVLAKAGFLEEGRRMQEFATIGRTVEVPVMVLGREAWSGAAWARPA